MKRRSFLAALLAAPALPAVAHAAPASDPLDFSGFDDDLDAFAAALAADGHFRDGAAYRVRAANIDEVTAGKLIARSSYGKRGFDLGTGTIRFDP